MYFMHEPTAPAYAQTLMKFARLGNDFENALHALLAVARDERQFLAAVDRVFAGLGGREGDLLRLGAKVLLDRDARLLAWITRSCGVMPDSRLAVSSTGMFAFTTMWFGLKK